MKHKLNKVLMGMLATQCLIAQSSLYAAEYKDERYGLTFSTENAAKVDSCLIGISPLTRQIETSSTDISGALSFIRSYSSNLQLGFNPNFRANTDIKRHEQSFALGSVLSLSQLGVGWSHNYNFNLDILAMIPSSPAQAFHFALFEPGETVPKMFRRDNNGAFKLVQYSRSAGTYVPISSSLNEYNVQDNSDNITITRKGIVYIYTSLSGKRTKNDTNLKLKTVKYPNGRVINLDYAPSLLNAQLGELYRISDNRGNTININRIGKDDVKNPTKTDSLVGGISSVETVSNNNLKQKVEYYYELQDVSYNGTINSSLPKLKSVKSTKNGQEDYAYVNYNHKGIFTNSIDSPDFIPQYNGVNIPILSRYSKNGEEKLGWEATQNKIISSLYKPNYNPIDSELEFSETAIGGVLKFRGPTRYKMDGFGSESYGRGSLIVNNTGNTISYDGSNNAYDPYNDENRCIKINGRPVKKITLDKVKGSIVNFTDKNGNLTEIGYDNKNRVTAVTEAKGSSKQRLTTNTYNTNYNIPSTISVDKVKLTNEIEANGRVKSSTLTSTQPNSIAKTTNYDYFANGLIRSVDGPRLGTSDKINYTYDNFGNITSSSQIVNGTTRITKYLNYNSYGLPERIIYPNGLVEQYIYNADGTLKETRKGMGGEAGDISGQVTVNTYNEQKLLESITAPDGEKTTYQYGIGDLLMETNYANGTKQKVKYNVLGIPEIIDGPIKTINNYVARDLIKETWDGATFPNQIIRLSSTKYGHDLNGNLISRATSFDNIKFDNTETWEYDALNRADTHKNAYGNIDTIGFDLLNNKISINDALLGGSNPISYRNGNVKTSEVNKDFNTKTYSYNETDMLTDVVHGNRKCSYPIIDELGRAKNYKCVSTSGTTPDDQLVDYTYHYDNSRFGRLDSITSASSYGVNTSFSYDNYDRITQKQQTNKALVALGFSSNSLTVNYGYSNAGKLTSLKLPSGKKINYVYESGNTGRLSSINIDDAAIVSYKYGTPLMIGNSNLGGNPGLISSLNWSNGTKTSFGYGALGVGGLLTSISTKDSANNSIANFSYEFFDNKAISKITVNDNRGTTFTDNFTYNITGALRKELRENGGKNIFEKFYLYRQNNNIITIGTRDKYVSLSGFNYIPNTNKISSYIIKSPEKKVSYLPTGELELPATKLTYDFAGRRVLEQDNATANKRYMSYGNKNERTLKAYSYNNGNTWDSSKLIQYVYDENNNLIGEYDVSGQAIVEYVWSGNTPIAALYANGTSSKLYYIIADINNTPRRLIDSTNNSIAWSWDGSAYGLGDPTVQDVKFNLRFPGQYYDAETKLHYNLNRYYSPELGRYIEPDRIGLEGGLNPYIYADANPVNKVDPSGAYAIRTEDANNIIYTIPAKFNLSSGVTDINRQALISTAESKLKTTYNGKNFIVKYVEVNESNATMYPIFNNITIKSANERNFGCPKGQEASGGCAAYVSNSDPLNRIWDQMTLFSDSYPAMAHETMHVLGSDKDRYSYIGNIPVPDKGWEYDVMGDKTQPVTKLSIDYIHRDGNEAIGK
ncbi:RHS repeat-associated core domain-containing protein [Acinetobacter guillouiae]|uniref:RHS repeat-associated core domain-containing protein n=1 Tax=Acinetobacter guillouiae TaxID=106649 RepID=UPI003AF7ED78